MLKNRFHVQYSRAKIYNKIDNFPRSKFNCIIKFKSGPKKIDLSQRNRLRS